MYFLKISKKRYFKKISTVLLHFYNKLSSLPLLDSRSTIIGIGTEKNLMLPDSRQS